MESLFVERVSESKLEDARILLDEYYREVGVIQKDTPADVEGWRLSCTGDAVMSLASVITTMFRLRCFCGNHFEAVRGSCGL
jgi:hypothetical protein